MVRLNEAEARRGGVSFPQGWFGAVNAVQSEHERLQLAMVLVFEQMPVETLVVVPFVPLAEFAASEQHLLARPRPHVAVKRAQVRKLLPAITRHLREQRPLAVNDFIMGQRQDEVLTPRVEKAEGDIAMMV